MRHGLTALVLIALAACNVASPPESESFADGRITAVRTEPSGVNAYVVATSDTTAVLIDTGVEPEPTAVIAELERRGLDAGSVTDIFLTHGHGDHIGGVLAFENARVHAFEVEEPLIAGEVHPTRPLPSFGAPEPTGIEVTDLLTDGAVISLGEVDIEVYAIPGHTDGSAAFVIAGVLFLGDAATANTEGALDNAIWIFSKDTSENLVSLAGLSERLRGRDDITVLAPSHSGALPGGLGPLERLVILED